MEVEIEYCVPCGYLPRALDAARAVLNGLRREVAGLRLVPGEDGVFRVTVDGRTVFSKRERGRFPETEELLSALRAST